MFDTLLNTLHQNKLSVGLGFVGVVLLIAGISSSGLIKSSLTKSSVKQPAYSTVKSEASIRVDVSGEVIRPGVYTFGKEDRVEQAIQAAGGVTDKADPEYIIKQINLAQHLTDGMKLYIPQKGETVAQSNSVVLVTSAGSTGVININQASASELDTLVGVGLTTAQKIIAGRPYQTTEELVSKKVVSKTVYLKIKDSIIAQ
jgi:competence protein ComEA